MRAGVSNPFLMPILPFAQAMMYMVCDGHGGSKAAKFAAANMHRYLVSKLPQQLPNFSVQQGAGMQITGWCTA